MVPDFSSTETRVLLAVVNGHRHYADIIEASGVSRGHVHWCLTHLRDAGLVDWDDGKRGTLRALVTEVPFG